MARIGFAFGSLLLMALLAAPVAVACSCVMPPPPQVALEEADAVFVGEVTGIHNEPGTYPGGLRISLRVLHPIKGASDERMTVHTADNTAACGFPFEQEGRYFVYATTLEGRMHVSLCSRTARLEDAGEDLDAFDVPDGFAESANASRRCGGVTNTAALQALFLVGLGVLLLRRRM